MGMDEVEPVHPNVAALGDIEAGVKVGDYGAPVASVSVGGDEVTVHVYVSPEDGAVVVQVDTATDGRRVRFNLNDCTAYDGVTGE